MRCCNCGRDGPLEDFQMDETIDDEVGEKEIIGSDLNCPACGSDDVEDSEGSGLDDGDIECPNCGMVSHDLSDFEGGCHRCGYSD